MTEISRNYIGGEWVEGPQRQRNINPSNTDDVVGDYAQADAAQARSGRRGRQGGVPGLVAVGHRRSATTSLEEVGDEILARKDELGRLLSREEGKTLAEGIGETVRAGADLQVLRRRVPAPGGREARPRCGRASGSRSRASRSAWSG